MKCERCGQQPAVDVTSKWHLGLIVYGRTTRKEGFLCRSHARSMILGDLAKTLLLGWWGMLSFFINFTVIAGQVVELASVAKMDDATPVPDDAPIAAEVR